MQHFLAAVAVSRLFHKKATNLPAQDGLTELLRYPMSWTWRVPQSVGQLNFGIDAGKGFGCHPLLKSIS
jgi:hypothetical protein